ncbi:MAG: metallophosphoesterase family protein [Bryobacteraceae bacterium]
MRYLILSDIHSNWEALAAVLRHAEGSYDRVVCCGDFVGYGADPNRVVQWARAHVAAAVRGNHEKGAVGLTDLDWFNPAAREAAEWTARELTPENYAYLRSLPKGPQPVAGFEIMHGSPADEDEYLMSVVADDFLLPFLSSRVAFFGHTHCQGGFLFSRKGARRIPAVPEEAECAVIGLDPGRTYLVNPGSVGQPRDGDPRAAYAIYDEERGEVELRRVPYEIAIAQAKILRAGLPGLLALRLEQGY